MGHLEFFSLCKFPFYAQSHGSLRSFFFFSLSVVLCEPGGRQQDTWAALRRSNPRRTQVIRLRGSVYQLSSCRGRLEPSWKSTSVYGYSVRALRRRWREGTFRGQGVLWTSCRGFKERSPTAVPLQGGSEGCLRQYAERWGGGEGHMAI